jgi:hypothetical protein
MIFKGDVEDWLEREYDQSAAMAQMKKFAITFLVNKALNLDYKL